MSINQDNIENVARSILPAQYATSAELFITGISIGSPESGYTQKSLNALFEVLETVRAMGDKETWPWDTLAKSLQERVAAEFSILSESDNSFHALTKYLQSQNIPFAFSLIHRKFGDDFAAKNRVAGIAAISVSRSGRNTTTTAPNTEK